MGYTQNISHLRPYIMLMSTIVRCPRIFAFSQYQQMIKWSHHILLMSPDLVRPFLTLSDDFRWFPTNFAFGRCFATSHVWSRPVTTATRHCAAPQKSPACQHVKSCKDVDVGIVLQRHFGQIARVTWLYDRCYRLDIVDWNVGPFCTCPTFIFIVKFCCQMF